MKRFRLHGKSANWMNGLRMSALNLSTLSEETSTPIPNGQRMYVNVANNVFHVNDTRREVLNGSLSKEDKDAILSRLQNDTPDFLLTLEDKVVGYAILHDAINGKRVNRAPLPESVLEELDELQDCYDCTDMSEETYNAERKAIIGGYLGFIILPEEDCINVQPKNVRDTVEAPCHTHSFAEDGLTDTQRDITREVVVKLLSRLFELRDADSIADSLIEDVCEDIETSADWSGYAKDEVDEDDILIALRRVLKSWMAL